MRPLVVLSSAGLLSLRGFSARAQLQGSGKFRMVNGVGWQQIYVCDKFAHQCVAIASCR